MAALHEDRLDSSAKLLQEIMNAPDKGIPEAAAHAVLMKLFPEQKASLDAAYAASLAQIPDGSGKTAGIGVGEEVTGKILALRTSDGADAPNTYRPSTATGVYVPTTLPIGSQWGNVTPWVMVVQSEPGLDGASYLQRKCSHLPSSLNCPPRILPAGRPGIT